MIIASSSRESRYHLATKHGTADMLRTAGVIHVDYDDGCRYRTLRLAIPDGAEVITECGYPHLGEVASANDYCAEHGDYPLMIFDIAILSGGQLLGVVEVMKSHWLDTAKVAKLNRERIGCIGIGARDDALRDLRRLEAKTLVLPTAHRLPLEGMR